MALGTALDPLCDPLYVNLLKMASLTKKIIAQQSQATLAAVMCNTSPLPRLVLPLLSYTLQDKAIQPRTYAMGHIKTYLSAHGQAARHSIEASGGVETLEKCIKKGLSDPNPAVKQTSREAFWVFEEVWKERGRAMLESMDGLSRKQLEKACPKPELLAGLSSTVAATPQAKKSSVAAAIAASRAKAKAIATAPPSLRHQATSAARTTSPPAKRPASPSLSSSTSGPPARAASPVSRAAPASSPPQRARVVSGGTLSRSTSSGFVPNREHREQVRQVPPVPATPPSPTPDPVSRRRVSSPLASSPNGGASLRRAAQTALPASPPRSSVLLQGSALLRAQPPQPQQPPYGGYALTRESINLAGMHAEDSLLLASNIPIPEDSDSDMDVDTSAHLISFSTPYEVYPPPAPAPGRAPSFSPRSSSSRPPRDNALSTGTSSPPAGAPPPIVEDALRARAEQAESAAERLLELVDPEDEAAALLRDSTPQPPRTPVAKGGAAAALRKAALFQDSPAYKARAATSPFDMLNGQAGDNAWWRKRMSRKSLYYTCAGSSRRGAWLSHRAC